MEDKVSKQAIPEHKMVFIHIPKNYGTSLVASMFGLPGTNTHATANQVAQLSAYEDYGTFCFTREPIKRFVSVYCWRKRPEKEPENVIHTLGLRETIDLLTEDTVAGPHGPTWEENKGKLSKMFRPQLTWCTPTTELYRCENIRKEYALLKRRYGPFHMDEIIHTNFAPKPSKNHWIEQDLRWLLSTDSSLQQKFFDWYADDYHALGYKMEF
jgi:hypothetical protein